MRGGARVQGFGKAGKSQRARGKRQRTTIDAAPASTPSHHPSMESHHPMHSPPQSVTWTAPGPAGE
jgi:hypothetical protein